MSKEERIGAAEELDKMIKKLTEVKDIILDEESNDTEIQMALMSLAFLG